MPDQAKSQPQTARPRRAQPALLGLLFLAVILALLARRASRAGPSRPAPHRSGTAALSAGGSVSRRPGAAVVHALLRVARHPRLALLVYLLLIGLLLGEFAALQRRRLAPSRPVVVPAGTGARPPAPPAPTRMPLLTTATTVVGATVTASVAPTARATPEAVSVAVRIVEPPGQDTDHWAYTPATVVIHAGTTVEWVNTGRAPHTATADDGTRFDSATLYPQARFRFTPQQAGTIAYHCTLHPWMKGTLVVQP